MLFAEQSGLGAPEQVSDGKKIPLNHRFEGGNKFGL